MRKALLLTSTILALVSSSGCSKDEAAPAPAPSASAPPAVSASAPAAPASTPAPVAVEPPHDCPTGSTGVGSFAKPCEAKGGARMMDVKWKKNGDAGPSFAITNNAKLTVVYGKIAVYFYDKGGKQIGVKDDSSPAPRPFHTCAGKFFGGVMKPAEKAVLTFSCVPKSVIPEGTVSVEAEMTMVGFADPTEKTIDFYWRNNELAPDLRKKGGVK